MDEATILVLGSHTSGHDVLYEVRRDLIGVDGSFDDRVDAAVYTGTTAASPDRLGTSPERECERLEALFSGVAADVPVFVVPGAHDRARGDRSRAVEAYASPVDDGADYVGEFDDLTYVPRDDVVSAGGVRATANPALADDDCLLVTHRFHPELFDRFESVGGAAYLSGEGLTGRYREDCLNAVFSAHDLGAGADPCRGGYYVVDVDGGIADVRFEAVGDLTSRTCERHRSRGRVQTLAGLGCPFCAEASEYFEELLRASAFDARRESAPDHLSALVGRAVERDAVSDDQRDALREFGLERTAAVDLFDGVVGTHRDAGDARGPDDVVTAEYL